MHFEGADCLIVQRNSEMFRPSCANRVISSPISSYVSVVYDLAIDHLMIHGSRAGASRRL
jgi:hypothetical protein